MRLAAIRETTIKRGALRHKNGLTIQTACAHQRDGRFGACGGCFALFSLGFEAIWNGEDPAQVADVVRAVAMAARPKKI